MNMINRMNNDLDNNLLGLRLFQANQDLLLAARHDQEQRLSFARPSFAPIILGTKISLLNYSIKGISSPGYTRWG
jgi:hypothetical protein